jgi:hypothetical protein
MRKRRGALFGATVVVLAGLLVGTAPAGAAKAPPLKVGDACTMLTDAQIARGLKQPVAAKAHFYGKLNCDYTLGTDAAAPTGTFSTYQAFPSLYPTGGAESVFEDERAINGLSGDTIEEIDGIGKAAYFNATKQKIVVLATGKYTFELTWKPAPAGTTLTPRDEARLKSLAKTVAARTKH